MFQFMKPRYTGRHRRPWFSRPVTASDIKILATVSR